jgi:hypothetical protein
VLAAAARARGEARASDAREVAGGYGGNREEVMEATVQEEQIGMGSSPRFL